MSLAPTVAPRYVGRFAPSPSGPLHGGSLVTALASYLDARHHRGLWRVRMEDIDPPREQAGAADAILYCLDAHHLYWDGEVLFQSHRAAAYRQALAVLQHPPRPLAYRCTCSRQALRGEGIYNGRCRERQHPASRRGAIRLNVQMALDGLGEKPLQCFDDVLQGPQCQNLLTEVGDFVIHRKDGLFAYQLAVVVDDMFQHINHVIRGADLLDSTARQMLLFKLLGATPPAFGHVPLVLNELGQKLSKQNHAPALDLSQPEANLFQALCQLGQHPPPALQRENPSTILHWATEHWQRAKALAGGIADKDS